jgi:hypothetical protein
VQTGAALARLRRRRLLMWGLVFALMAPLVAVSGSRAASRWCAEEAFERPNARAEDVSLSLWVPGVRCSLEYVEGHRAKVIWPLDW